MFLTGNKEKTNSNQWGGMRGTTGERRGRVKSSNMYKGPKDKDNGGAGRGKLSVESGGEGMESSKEGNRGKMGTTIIEQQLNK